MAKRKGKAEVGGDRRPARRRSDEKAERIDAALRRLARPTLLEPVPPGWVTVIWQNHERRQRDDDNTDSEATDK
jgi:hypothetical protein